MTELFDTNSTAVVGLGLIGAAWAQHLESDGVLKVSWNRTPQAQAPRFSPTLGEVPKQASVIHVAVSDEHALTSVLEQLAPQLSERNVIIQSSTIDPATSDKAKSMVTATGAAYVEAPFTGSLPAAQERKTIFFLGGEPSAVDGVTPYLRRLSQAQFVIGTNRQACTLKLSMNLQIASAMTALAEAISICRSAGISDDLFYAVFKQNASFSGVAALKEPKIKGGDYSPQFSVKHMAKDMRLLQDSVPAQLPLLATVRNGLRMAEASGYGDEDFSVIVKQAAALLKEGPK